MDEQRLDEVIKEIQTENPKVGIEFRVSPEDVEVNGLINSLKTKYSGYYHITQNEVISAADLLGQIPQSGWREVTDNNTSNKIFTKEESNIQEGKTVKIKYFLNKYEDGNIFYSRDIMDTISGEHVNSVDEKTNLADFVARGKIFQATLTHYPAVDFLDEVATAEKLKSMELIKSEIDSLNDLASVIEKLRTKRQNILATAAPEPQV